MCVYAWMINMYLCMVAFSGVANAKWQQIKKRKRQTMTKTNCDWFDGNVDGKHLHQINWIQQWTQLCEPHSQRQMKGDKSKQKFNLAATMR